MRVLLVVESKRIARPCCRECFVAFLHLIACTNRRTSLHFAFVEGYWKATT